MYFAPAQSSPQILFTSGRSARLERATGDFGAWHLETVINAGGQNISLAADPGGSTEWMSYDQSQGLLVVEPVPPPIV